MKNASYYWNLVVFEVCKRNMLSGEETVVLQLKTKHLVLMDIVMGLIVFTLHRIK